MAEYDVVVRGGTIVDGTGIPRYKSDIGVKDGKVARISGKIPAGGAREIDASGCIVAPGAVDLHTHYDAQVNWDPYCSLSGWFGVTSLTIGECGFGFAPTKPEDRDLNMRMMNRIEAIPLESMRKGMRWDWVTFPEYMDSLERQGLGINIGAMFPFSPMRGYVLGMMESRERTSVTDTEQDQMKELFREAMQAGAFGFSFNKNMEDRPEDGSFLPSHVASDEEFHALAEVLSDFGVGHIGLTHGFGLSPEQRSAVRNLVTDLTRTGGRPFHVLDVEMDSDPQWIQTNHEEGLPLLFQRQCTVVPMEFKLSEFNLFDFMPNWIQPLVGTAAERAAKLRDSGVRDAMRQDTRDWPSVRTDWGRVRVLETVEERHHAYDGVTIKELGEMVGKDPLNALLDLALEEDLETEFLIPAADTPEELAVRERHLRQDYVHVSASDGGAHTRFLTNAAWPVYWLYHWIRDREIMSLERGVYKMSALPAWLADFKDRGTLRVGNWADIVVFDLDELGYEYERPVFANDFPGGEKRLIQKPTGLRYTMVNGTVTFEGNDCTGALPGKLLRSYDMLG